MHFQACHASRPVAGGRAGDQTRALLRLPTAVCVQLAGIAHQARVRFSRRGRSHDRRTPPRRRTVLCMTTARTARGTASSMPNWCVGVYIRAVGSTARTPPASQACLVSRSRTPVRARVAVCNDRPAAVDQASAQRPLGPPCPARKPRTPTVDVSGSARRGRHRWRRPAPTSGVDVVSFPVRGWTVNEIPSAPDLYCPLDWNCTA